MSSAPAVRSAGGYAFHNAGPLTTTWTAPSACSTVQTSYTGVGYPNEQGNLRRVYGSCSRDEEFQAECHPNGDAMLEINESIIEEEGLLPTTYHYYINSPGLYCPDKWETVGVASYNNETLDASGVFASTSFLQPSYFPNDEATMVPTPSFNFPVNALTSVLASTETAIVCCPSGFSAHPVNGCYSYASLSVLASSTLCMSAYDWENLVTTELTRNFEYFGTPITQVFNVAVTPTSTGTAAANYSIVYSTVTMDASGLPVIEGTAEATPTEVVVYWAPFNYLINSGEDGEGQGGGDSAGETGGTGNGESAAQSLRPVTSWLVGAAALFWTAGFIIGGGI
ncbi:hypothetical protein F5X68DRAFT_260925 [Plectosphaerella plurivora]|uniref:Uncharacterized protein n=1 Tax=Plectosphaerella plurivora TaxID=936078 RepID=A0A9P8VF57_9PEZI|nr:hypothetical protein F5X68DRAFT_260925 [Plectosphaerella plurivora]